MVDLFDLWQYLLFNLILCISYLFCKTIFNTSLVQHHLTQVTQLHLARRFFIFFILIFLITPFITKHLQLLPSSTLPFSFSLKKAGTWLKVSPALPVHVKPSNTSLALPSLHFALTLLFILSIALATFFHFRKLHELAQLTARGFIQKRIGRVQIIYNDCITIPFCWSTLTKHYILLPTFLLNEAQHLRMTLRHEAEHLRQGDTLWLHVMSFFKIICLFNPFIYLWCKWFHDLQEFACDEALIMRHRIDRKRYAQCLFDIAKKHALKPTTIAVAFCKKDYSILTRRVNMIFDYHLFKTKKITLLIAYAACALSASTLAYAIADSPHSNPISDKKLESVVKQSHLNVNITPEVVTEVNRIVTNPEVKAAFKQAFHNMQTYKPYISEQLSKNGMPKELLALPLVESGYKPLPQSENPVNAAGIWQFIPSTAKSFGLVINKKRDDRLNTHLSTQAAIAYLQALYGQFNDWKLAVIAYEIGEKNTDSLVKATGANDPWELIRLAKDIHIIDTKELSHFFASYEAATILINNPVLLT